MKWTTRSRNRTISFFLIACFVALSITGELFESAEVLSWLHQVLGIMFGVGLLLHVVGYLRVLRVSLIRSPGRLVLLALSAALVFGGLAISSWNDTMPSHHLVGLHHLGSKLYLIAVVVHLVQTRRAWLIARTHARPPEA